MQRFGEKLRTLRKHHHKTLKELTAELGYTAHSWLGHIELGQKEPTVRLVIEIARYFKVSTDALLFDELEIDLGDRAAKAQ